MADTWFFPADLNIEKFIFDNITIERIIDSRKNQHYPTYQVKVFSRDKELANYMNFTFEYIQAFDNGNYFFAGSNSGLSRFAYFVIDKKGGLVSAQTHSNSIYYCSQSISVLREWLPEKIEIKEEYYGWKGIFEHGFGSYSGMLLDYGLNGILKNDKDNYLEMLIHNDFESYFDMLFSGASHNNPYETNQQKSLKDYLKNEKDKSLSVARIKNCIGNYIDILKL